MRKLRMGMIGGGKGAFIGSVHRIAANMDGLIELVCGAFSSDPQRSHESGKELMLEPDRIYGSYAEMIQKEAALPPDRRMDFVSIVTPNHLHFKPAMLALEHGFHVVIEKPATFNLEEAVLLRDKATQTNLVVCLTHTYAGYPMIKEARERVARGDIGSIRKIFVQYLQGWLSQPAESEGNQQAAWRTDPAKSGMAGCMGDIGTHAAHLAEFVSGKNITHICADINTLVPGRQLDDDGNVLLKFDNDIPGMLTASQIAAGEENNLILKIYGDKGGLEWHQQEPNTLLMKWLDKPAEVIRTGAGTAHLSSFANFYSRTPGGHPEGYLEAFANLYKSFALTVASKIDGREPSKEMTDFPTLEDGVRGMAFIETVIRAGKSSEKWLKLEANHQP